MRKIDSSKALERTLLNWQRTALSMFVVSTLSIKIALVNEQRATLLLVTFVSLFASSVLIVLRFVARPSSDNYVPIMLVASTIVVVCIGIVCTISAITK